MFQVNCLEFCGDFSLSLFQFIQSYAKRTAHNMHVTYPDITTMVDFKKPTVFLSFSMARFVWLALTERPRRI